ncbi:MAG TPA: hypothetical protein PKM73_19945 [Verrucomicrobiota bacterium]|nr:hypothetical protein [Verrucomicrobiota bacterium]HNU51248.1 hypothetical protein [Verrucomicrobiota bacterium]
MIKKKITEVEQRRAAEIGDRNPLAVFFSRIEASVSGSLRPGAAKLPESISGDRK